MTNEQSAAVNNLVIEATAKHGINKPKEILRFLQENSRAKDLTIANVYQRLCRLKKSGRSSRPLWQRTAEQMEEWRQSIAAIVNGQTRQLGVRGVFYLAVAAGLCEKTNSSYQAVQKALDILRMSGEVGFDRIIDAGRTIYPHGLDERNPVNDLVTNSTDYYEIETSVASTVYRAAKYEPSITPPEPPNYLQGMEPDELAESIMESEDVDPTIDYGTWDGCKVVPFVICEKEGLSGIIQPICYRYDVPFVAVRGGASITVLHQLWEMMQVGELPWRLLTLYDYDKAGEDIEHAAMSRLRAFGGEAKWTSKRVAVTAKQVSRLKLPTRPEKNGDGEAVELDAIPPDTLAKLVTSAIKACIPKDIDVRRDDALHQAREDHQDHVRDMVDEATQEYEPQRNEEMQVYVQQQQPKFERLRREFERDAPE